MAKIKAGERLQEYNRLYWEADEIYRTAMRKLGIPEGAFWILYCLRADGEDGEKMTQSEMGRILHLPKQTLNSALKKMEAEGILELAAGQDRRSKYVLLTKSGKKLAEKTADRLIDAENRTFENLTDKEQRTLLELLGKYNSNFRKNVEDMKGESER